MIIHILFDSGAARSIPRNRKNNRLKKINLFILFSNTFSDQLQKIILLLKEVKK